MQGGLPYMAKPPALSETPMLFQVVKFWVRTKPSLCVPSLYNHMFQWLEKKSNPILVAVRQ